MWSIGELEEASVVTMMWNYDRNEKKKHKEKIVAWNSQCNIFYSGWSFKSFAGLDLSESHYRLLRESLINKNFDTLPSYNMLTNAKKLCYPPPSTIKITDTGVKVNLQDLLDHTTARISKIENVYNPKRDNLKLLTKWGCDGSSGKDNINKF